MSFLRLRSPLALCLLAVVLLALSMSFTPSTSLAHAAEMESELELGMESEMEAEVDMQSELSMEAQAEIEAELEAAEHQHQPTNPLLPPFPVAVQNAPPTTDPSGLTPAGTTPAGGVDSSEVGMCEVCMYVMENKMQHQPYLCKGLKDPHYQNLCVQVMESLMWWVSNQVYWVNYGCQMNQNGAISWVRPCPAHAICSWLQHLYLRKPYCAADKNFPKPA